MISERHVSETRDEWRRSWMVVLASSLGIRVSIFHTASLGVMIQLLQHELGWTRTETTLGLTVVSVFAVAQDLPGCPLEFADAQLIAEGCADLHEARI